MKPVAFAVVAVACLLCASCREEEPQEPPVVYQEAPDYKPIGDGIKVHSYALVGVSVIIAIALMSRDKNN